MNRAWYAVPAGVLVGGAIALFAPGPDDMTAMLAITAFCIALWITTPVPPWLTGLVGIGLIGVTFSPSLALVGFQLPATWLIVLGILVGEAVRESGLASLVKRWLLAYIPESRLETGDAVYLYRYLLVALSVAGLAFAVVIPSALVRILILAPIASELGDVFESTEAKIGLFLGPLFATYYGGTGLLTGSLANIIVTGIMESTAGQTISWTGWFVNMFPLMSVGRVAVVVAVAYLLYRPSARSLDVDPEAFVQRTAPTGEERRMLLFLLLGVAVWATDFLHGLHPVFGALLVVVLSFLPRVGVVGFDVADEAEFSIVFFIGAIFAIAEGLSRTGFTDAAAQAILARLPEHAPLWLVLATVFLLMLATTLVLEGLAAGSVITPVFVSYAQGAGLPLAPVMMTEAAALSVYFFPYQSIAMVAILTQDVVDTREIIRTTTLISLGTILILMPLQIGLFALLY